MTLRWSGVCLALALLAPVSGWAQVTDSSGERALRAFSDQAMASLHAIDWGRCLGPDRSERPSPIAQDLERFNPPRVSVRLHQGDGHSFRRRPWSEIERGGGRALGAASGRPVIVGASAVPVLVDRDGRQFPLVPKAPSPGEGFDRYVLACEPEQSVAKYPDLYASILLFTPSEAERERLLQYLQASAGPLPIHAQPVELDARFLRAADGVELRALEAQRMGPRLDTVSRVYAPVFGQDEPVAFLHGWDQPVTLQVLGHIPPVAALEFTPPPGTRREAANPAPQREASASATAAADPVTAEVGSAVVTLAWPPAWGQPTQIRGCVTDAGGARAPGRHRCRPAGPVVIQFGPGWAPIELSGAEAGGVIDLATRLRPAWPFAPDEPLLRCSAPTAPCYFPAKIQYCRGASPAARCCPGRGRFFSESTLPSLAELRCARQASLPTVIHLRLDTLRLVPQPDAPRRLQVRWPVAAAGPASTPLRLEAHLINGATAVPMP